MKKLLVVLFLSSLSLSLLCQSKEAGTEMEAIKKYMTTKDNGAMLTRRDVDEVKKVLREYNNSLEKLDFTGTEKLFTSDSKIFESGGSEGTYAHYKEHHMTPEFKDFSSFIFSDHKADVQVAGKYAFATETYSYNIVLAKDKTEAKRKGVATSVLKKQNGQWKIWISHNSSRKGS
ncbi:MAG: nuclear transport factor 2 family protein [Ferruginibacter sp.]